MKSRYSLLAVVLSIIILLPLFLLVVWALVSRWPWPDLFPEAFTGRGLEQLVRQQHVIRPALRSSLVIGLIVAFLSVVIALLTSRALLTVSASVRAIILFMITLPMLIPATVFGMGVHTYFIRWGLQGTVSGLVISHLVYSLPYACFLLIEVYQNIGLNLEEQARMLGANAWQSFIRVTLPILAPIILTAFSMSYIVSFSQYFMTLLIGGGKIQTFSVVMFPYLQDNDRTISSSYSLVFLIFTFVIFMLFEAGVKYYQRRVFGDQRTKEVA